MVAFANKGLIAQPDAVSSSPAAATEIKSAEPSALSRESRRGRKRKPIIDDSQVQNFMNFAIILSKCLTLLRRLNRAFPLHLLGTPGLEVVWPQVQDHLQVQSLISLALHRFQTRRMPHNAVLLLRCSVYPSPATCATSPSVSNGSKIRLMVQLVACRYTEIELAI